MKRTLAIYSCLVSLSILSCNIDKECINKDFIAITRVDSLQMGKMGLDSINDIYLGFYNDSTIRYIAVDNKKTNYKIFIALDFHDSVIGIERLYKDESNRKPDRVDSMVNGNNIKN